MPITKATQNVITPNIVTTDTTQTITGIKTISVNSASTALTITQTGSGEALRVEDSASPDSTPFVVSNNGSVTLTRVGGPIQNVNATTNLYSLPVSGMGTKYCFKYSPYSNNLTTSFNPNIPAGYYKVYVNATVSVQNNTTADFNWYYSAYQPSTDGILIGETTLSGVTSYTVNGVATVNNFSTLLFTGSGQSQGGVPTPSYVSIQGGSNLTLTMRNHTNPDTTQFWYGSDISVYFIGY